MGVKSFVNSRNGRVGIMITFLSLVAIGLSGGLLWWMFYLPQLSTAPLAQQVLEEGSVNFNSVALESEENPLSGLPSSTLAVEDTFQEEIPNSAFDYVQNTIEKSSPESLINAHIYRESRESPESNMTYDFKFYSSSLNDYDDDGSFSVAQGQFRALAEFGAKGVTFVSAPLSSGGRELTIKLTASADFTASNQLSFQNNWKDLLTDLEKTVTFGGGNRIDLTVQDSSGKLQLKAVLNSTETVKQASNLSEGMWKTFSVYLFSGSYRFLDARSISYSIERTSQDSVMTITVGENAGEPDALVKNMWSTARDSFEGALFPGSYITYLVNADNPVPLVSFPSSSRNW